MEKMSLNKFTHIPLLKNDENFKKKKNRQITTQKRAITQNFYKNKKHVLKKSHPVKIKIKYHIQALKYQKKKRKNKKKKRGNVNAQKKIKN